MVEQLTWEQTNVRHAKRSLDETACPEKSVRQIHATLSVAASNMCVAEQLKRIADALESSSDKLGTLRGIAVRAERDGQ